MYFIVTTAGFIVTVCFILFIVWSFTKNPNLKSFSSVAMCIAILFLIANNQIWFSGFWWFINVLHGALLIYLLVYCFVSLSNVKNKIKLRAMDNLSYKFKVSVVVVVHNEEQVIVQTISNLLNLNYNKELLEIIIIDDCSNDKTLELIRKFQGKVKIIENKNNIGKPASINEIVPTLDSDLICIFDGDSLPETDFIRKGVMHFFNEEIALIQCRNMQYNYSSNIISKMTSLDIDALQLTVYKGKNNLKGINMFEGRGGIIRKSVFQELKGFDVNLPTEDWDFSVRCQINGYTVIHDETIINFEQTVETYEGYWNQRYRWFSSTILTFGKNIHEVLRSSKTSLVQKVDVFFNFSFASWALTNNLLGFLYIINIYKGYQFSPHYIFVFLLMQIIYLIPALLEKRKLHNILYIPVMYIYAWSFTFIITTFMIKYFILNSNVKFKKAEHNSLVLKKYFESKI